MDENKKRNVFSKIANWSRNHKRISIPLFSFLALVIIASVVTLIVIYIQPQKTQTVVKHEAKKATLVAKPVIHYSPLTGEVVPSSADLTSPVTAIMIENSPDARPQSGIKQAGVVFEAIAEGGITRFLTLHQQDKPQIIGPVRSVRAYYVDWLAAFDPSIAHVGGSAAALAEVRNGTFKDLDQFFNASSYWRSTDRVAPHNVYTSFAKLDALNAAKGYTTSTFTGFTRTDAKQAQTPTATKIAINFSSALYNTTYTYDPTTNTYPRSEGGAPHLDREDGQIAPSVVIAMHVQESTVLQDGYREAITTIGSGKASIFQNGTATDGTWTKKSQTSQITFTDDSGKDIPLVRGQTWIAAVPNNGGSVSWQ